MSIQTLIQIRVDTDLKDQVTELYEQIGIDIPTAIIKHICMVSAYCKL